MTPLLVVGAHLDDAVLSCGRLLAATPGAVVCTVFAGRPDPARGHAAPGTTQWDAWCGFGPADDVLAVRCAEDDAALGELGARAVRLGIVDAQYASAPDVGDLADALDRVVRDTAAERVVVPLGLLHRDHRFLTAAWARLVVRDGVPDGWWVGEDAPYRAFVPTVHRLAALARTGVVTGAAVHMTDEDVGAVAAARRRRALAAYTSQRDGLRTLDARAHRASGSAGSSADVLRPLVPAARAA